MAFNIGQTPETIEVRAKFNDRDNRSQQINGVCKFRTPEEYAAWQDELIESTKAEREGANASETITVAEFNRRRTEDRFMQILDSWESWDLKEPLTEETLKRLLNFAPSAINAMCASYAAACLEGARGN